MTDTAQKFTKFDYLLNAMTEAGRQDKPADHGYGDKRHALFAYVRELEAARAAPAQEPVDTEAIPDGVREALLDCAGRAGVKYDCFGDYIFPPMDSNEVLALMTGAPLPARYGSDWRAKFARPATTSPAAPVAPLDHIAGAATVPSNEKNLPAAAPQALSDDDRIFTLWKIANAELGGDDSHDWTDFAAGARAILAAPVTPPALLREAMEALENSENEMRRDLWPDHPSRKQNAAAITKLRAALKETP